MKSGKTLMTLPTTMELNSFSEGPLKVIFLVDPFTKEKMTWIPKQRSTQIRRWRSGEGGEQGPSSLFFISVPLLFFFIPDARHLATTPPRHLLFPPFCHFCHISTFCHFGPFTPSPFPFLLVVLFSFSCCCCCCKRNKV